MLESHCVVVRIPQLGQKIPISQKPAIAVICPAKCKGVPDLGGQ